MPSRRDVLRALGAATVVVFTPSAATAHHRPGHGKGKPTPDTTAPVVMSGPTVTVTSSPGATVAWTTDERSDSEVEYQAV